MRIHLTVILSVLVLMACSKSDDGADMRHRVGKANTNVGLAMPPAHLMSMDAPPARPRP